MSIISLEDINKNTDERGELLEFLREDENKLNFVGQIYVSSFEPFAKRGDHYHKERSEIFTVIKGGLTLHAYDLNTGLNEKITISCEKETLKKILIPPLTVHTFVNGENCSILISYTNLIYDKLNTDTFKHIIEI
jgi:dTDP-4-dehydrorhamnose 3,5-epimerase